MPCFHVLPAPNGESTLHNATTILLHQQATRAKCNSSYYKWSREFRSLQAAQIEEQEETDTHQFLDLEGVDDDDDEVNSLEEEFEGEKGRRSLASIFESDDEVLEVDAEMQDESLLVRFLLYKLRSFVMFC